jgi:hypothetical protein
MAEANEKQTGSFQNWLYRAELGHTSVGSPTLKIIPTNPKGDFAGARQITACIYEIAAQLERKADELGVSWAISAQPSDSMVTVELTRERQERLAEDTIKEVLAEMNIR